jgi:hypothetical protein
VSEPDETRTTPVASLEAVGWWGAGLFAAVVHAGLWATPNLETFAAAAAAFPGSGPVTGPGDYVLSTTTVLGVAKVLGWTEPHEYARLSLVAVILGSATLVWLGWARGRLPLARAVAVVIAASPLVTVSLQWLGQPDPVTGGCALAAVLVRRRWAVVVLGILSALTHPEQAVLAFAAVAAIRWAWPDGGTRDAGKRRLDVVAPLGGVLAGVAAGRLFALIAGIEVSRSRLDYMDFGLARFLEHHRAEPAALAWNLLGPLWLLVGALVVFGILSGHDAGKVDSDRRRLAVTTAIVAAVALLPVLFTLDETRVYAVLTAPLLASLAWFTAALPENRARWLGAGLLALTAIVPGGFNTGTAVWRHDLDSSAMARFVIDGSQPPGSPPIVFWLLEPLDVTIPDLPGS